MSENAASLSSDITDNGGQNIKQRGFAYKVYQEGMPEPTILLDKYRTVSLEAEEFSARLVDLQPQTRYIVRSFATNNTGTGYGQAVIFTTEELKIPQLTCIMGDVTAFAATPTATISTNGGFKVTEYGFCWSTESQVPTIENLKTVTGTAETDKFSEVINDLNPQTTYYLRAYAINEKGTGYSNILTFTTKEKQVATLTTPVASHIEVTSATLSSSLTVPAGVEVTEKGICYSIFSTRPATDGPHVADRTQGNSITAELKDLNEGASYYATAYAVTRDGTFYSDAVLFTLGRTYEPTVTIDITGIGETEATVNVGISTDGGREVTEKGICWSRTSSTPTLEADQVMKYEGSGNAFSLKLTSLEKGQKYYVRAYAKNVNGTGYSPAFEFTTALTKEPEVVNMTMPAVHDDHATAQAVISNKGGLEVTERGFVYSTTVVSPVMGAAGVTKVASASKDDTFTAELTGLAIPHPILHQCVRHQCQRHLIQFAHDVRHLLLLRAEHLHAGGRGHHRQHHRHHERQDHHRRRRRKRSHRHHRSRFLLERKHLGAYAGERKPRVRQAEQRQLVPSQRDGSESLHLLLRARLRQEQERHGL